MAFKVTRTKEESLAQLAVLVKSFEKDYAVYKSPKYSEAQLRIDFINPLLKTFGWDVDNEDAKSQFMRDVLQEESIDVEEEDIVAKKNPDYTLRIQGVRKYFIEAKKVSINIEKSKNSSFQTRRYGWNANLSISLLTNFESISVYDCRYKPNSSDEPNVAKYQSYHFSKFIDNYEEIYSILSFNSVESGYIDEYFSVATKESMTFDLYFLEQIENWRKRLAIEVVANNDGLDNEDINFLIQRMLNRIVFLRICEDREIEKYETLKNIKSYTALKQLFILADKKYNSGLFDFIEDVHSLKIDLKSEVLIEIFNELYYPQSPYDFSVVDPSILSQIYERYLGSKISIVNEHEIAIIEELEVAASEGVVPTPKMIVNNIVKETLMPLLEDKSLLQLEQVKIADICCGSGTFLISAYDFMLEKVVEGCIANKISNPDLICVSYDGSYKLSLKLKQKILKDNIYGVDSNPYAVEVSKFSLLLKLLEGEKAGSINNYLLKYKCKALPNLDSNIKCGNSLIDDSYYTFDSSALDNDELLYKLKLFNWEEEFPFLTKTKGFDAIIGNPPYIRIQNIAKYWPEELKFYQSEYSGYIVAQKETFDKYYLFIQRAISLLNAHGIVGYIVPNKFFVVKGGEALRNFIVSNSSVFKIIHFGVQQVFPHRSTYTAILILDKKARKQFYFKRIKCINRELIGAPINFSLYNSSKLSDAPWLFTSDHAQAILDKVKAADTIALNSITEITVGLQTSADKVFIFMPIAETKEVFRFISDGEEREVEKEICRPCLMDLPLRLFDTVKPNAQIIFPYKIKSGKASVFSESFFKKNYPLTWKYLNKFKAQLSKRSISGGISPKWYQYGRSQSITKFQDTDKLVWPVLSKEQAYIFDDSNLLFTGGGNGPYYSLIANSGYSLHYILGILAHPLFEYMIKLGASEFAGDYYSHGKQYIKNLPIKKIDFLNKDDVQNYNEIIEIVQKLIKTKSTYNSTNLSARKKVIKNKLKTLSNILVEKINVLYKISIDDVKTVVKENIVEQEPKEEQHG